MRASSRLKRADPACAARGKTPGGSRVMLILLSPRVSSSLQLAY